MTINEVVRKLSIEMVLITGHAEDMSIYRKYLNMALVVGTEHFSKDMIEIIAMNYIGKEVGHFKSIRQASIILGIDRRNIYHVLEGKCHSAGGLIFVKSKDKILIERG